MRGAQQDMIGHVALFRILCVWGGAFDEGVRMARDVCEALRTGKV